jgi:putative acetyltransferase
MRTPRSLRRRGAGRTILTHILAEARARGLRRVSLETGSMAVFEPARALYRQFGFDYCAPFGDYSEDKNSVFMTLEL